jgi:hypothetical protein
MTNACETRRKIRRALQLSHLATFAHTIDGRLPHGTEWMSPPGVA